jgi:hypothetical protein
MQTKIIGISGKIGSGKDTFAQLFVKSCHNKCELHAFADKLREMVSVLTGVPLSLISDVGEPYANAVFSYTQEQKNIYLPEWKKTIGEILQEFGTNALRNHFDRDVFVKSLFSNKVKSVLNKGYVLLIPDVRFENEANRILKEGGMGLKY